MIVKRRRYTDGKSRQRNGGEGRNRRRGADEKLIAAAEAEFTTFYYYTILRVAAIGMEGEGTSGHFRRGKPGTSPYVASIMTADHD